MKKKLSLESENSVRHFCLDRMTIVNLFVMSLSLFFQIGCNAQEPANRAHCKDAEFDKKVASYLNFKVPTVSAKDVKDMKNALILDAREKSEYDVSHIPNAQYCGFKNFDNTAWQQLPKNTNIVVYCSIGYRSEKIGEKIEHMGFTNVHNLYGSIFEWVNAGYDVVDDKNNVVKKVHTYNKAWSKWVSADVEKVY